MEKIGENCNIWIGPQKIKIEIFTQVCVIRLRYFLPSILALDFWTSCLTSIYHSFHLEKHHQIQSGEKSEKSRVAQIFNANEGSNRKFVPKVILCVQFPLVHSVLFHSSLTRRQNKVDFVKCLKLLLLEKTMMMRATSITLASFLLS